MNRKELLQLKDGTCAGTRFTTQSWHTKTKSRFAEGKQYQIVRGQVLL